ncbi:ATPase AAA [Bifidobacterium ramosum]|uniref:AAA family ATPase n=1 Tax=Bifidobacterium ramosum TaxID=1798158 RepID=A0A6L4X206_9BIFI|nr:Ig-like domain-containing protein [Bifidobacterium ramosum]KAB8288798.1 ATPase AAA [Bifidobacterium ramosum]NEG71339.1 AAA family ATPase [Bifidobacterium ramosum]
MAPLTAIIRHMLAQRRHAVEVSHAHDAPLAGVRFALCCTAAAALIIIAGSWAYGSVVQPRLQFDDGTVWVTSANDRQAARLHVRAGEPDAMVHASSTGFDVVQHGTDTLLIDHQQLTGIRASTAALDVRVSIASGTTVMTGGGTVALMDDQGRVWAGRSDDLEAVSPLRSTPALRLGAGGRVAVTHDGAVYGYRPQDGMVIRLIRGAETSDSIEVGSLSDDERLEVDDFTVVDGEPVVLAGTTIRWRHGAAEVEGDEHLQLQSVDAEGVQSGWVTVAGRSGLYAVRLLRGAQTVVAFGSVSRNNDSSSTGSAVGDQHQTGGWPASAAARPVASGGCVHAAWAKRSENYLRICSAQGDDGHGKTSVLRTLRSVHATSDLVFRVNHRLVVLNDIATGTVWNTADESGTTVALSWNRSETSTANQANAAQTSTSTRRSFTKTCSEGSGTVEAEDDAFGARAGKTSVLDVLRNDRQTDCAVLRITRVSAPNGANVSLTPVHGARYLQLDATNARTGTVTATYDISDGRGQTASASITVTLHDGDVNTAPMQLGDPIEHEVEQGTSYVTNALAGFVDPDGDALMLLSATPQDAETVAVSSRADGRLTFQAGAMTAGRVGVELTVSDGDLTVTGITYFSIRPARTLAAVIDAVSVQTMPQTRVDISLRPYVHGTSAQPAQLAAVDAPEHATVAMRADAMSFSFMAAAPGTYYVPFTIMQNEVPGIGLARIEVTPASGEAAAPIAVNDTAIFNGDGTAIVEPLHNDMDPTGGIMGVTSASVDSDSGIDIHVESHRRIHVMARTAPVRPQAIRYTVENAAGSSTGTITVLPPAMSSQAAPVAGDITMSVRTGGIVSSDVLDHVTHPDISVITLTDVSGHRDDAFRGLLFVSGTTIRYQAGTETGTFHARYTVTDDLGNASSGTIAVTVHESDATSKTAPTPRDVQAQVAAGRTTRIPIPLSGIDPDGDDVTLLGLGGTAPTLGRITAVGADHMVYEAYADPSGTDTFTYAVEDWTGQRAQATVRVGIVHDRTASGVWARDDHITLRPGTTAAVPVVQNDIADDDAALSLDHELETQWIDDAFVSEGMIILIAPRERCVAYVTYTVRDETGLSDTATLTVTVDPDAPINPPEAHDYRVPATSTIDKRSVDVDVSAWITNPAGTMDELAIGVDPSASDAYMVDGQPTVIRVELTDTARSIPYTVTNVTHGLTSIAFIHVPAYGVFPPIPRPKAPPLTVNAGETIIIELADHVRVGAGKTVYAEPESVHATKAADVAVDNDARSLIFAAAGDYDGPASVTFTAIDGQRQGQDTHIINTAVITLPITIVGGTASSPIFVSPTIEVAAGETPTTIDLASFTRSASVTRTGTHHYGYALQETSSTHPVTASLSDSGRLTVAAAATAIPGTTMSIPIVIRYGHGSLAAGVTVRVVASGRPLSRLQDRTLTMRAGASERVDVLADAYNPFPDVPLSIVGCSDAAVSKLTVSGCAGTGPLTISASSDTGAFTSRITVTVRDGTAAAERQVSATIVISVADRPAPPLLSPVSGTPSDGMVRLEWIAGAANGKPILEYLVAWNDGTRSCGVMTSCRIEGLRNGTTYTFTVRARNEVGWSEPSAEVTARPDIAPPSPTSVTVTPGYRSAVVRWRQPTSSGTAPDRYLVTLSSSTGSYRSTVTVTEPYAEFEIPDTAITDGMTVSATVAAGNHVGFGETSQTSQPVRPWGDPAMSEASLSNIDDHGGMRLAILLGDMRNAGCARVSLSGGTVGQLTCDTTEHTFTAAKGQLRIPMTVTIAVHPQRDGAQPVTIVSNASTPGYTIGQPSDVRYTCAEQVCEAVWEASGMVDAFIVETGNGVVRTVTEPHAVFTLEPWQTFSGLSVRQTLNGHDGPKVSGTGEPYTYQVPAHIELPQSVSWSVDDPDIIDVIGGTIDTWGRAAEAMLVITPDAGISCMLPWSGGNAKLDTSHCSRAQSYTWSVMVASTAGEPALDRSMDGGTIDGIRIEPAVPLALHANGWVSPFPMHTLSFSRTVIQSISQQMTGEATSKERS